MLENIIEGVSGSLLSVGAVCAWIWVVEASKALPNFRKWRWFFRGTLLLIFVLGVLIAFHVHWALSVANVVFGLLLAVLSLWHYHLEKAGNGYRR